MKLVLVSVCTGVVMLAGCASSSKAKADLAPRDTAVASKSESGPKVVAAASEADRKAMLDRVKSLEGEWTMMDPESGKAVTASVFKAIAGGSAVREIMFPGSPHEMTNLYHMDGASMVMTHYCAAGNQPRMRATAGGASIEMKPDSVTNLTAAEEAYMGAMTLVFKDADHVEQRWVHYKGGKVEGNPVVFELTRKK